MSKDIFEIRLHGRGGQGAKTAAQLIVETAIDLGKHIQAFPEYGPERSGAPVQSYARISDKPIHVYSPITHPDVVLVIDPTLIGPINVAAGLGKKDIMIVNSDQSVEDMRKLTKFNGKIYILDATKISIDCLGRNIPNTPILGALAKITGVISLKSLAKKIEAHFLRKLGREKTDANIKAIKRGSDEVHE